MATSEKNQSSGGLYLLFRLKLQLLKNTAKQALCHRPQRIIGSVASTLILWYGLYVLLVNTFILINRQVFEGIVATPLIFTFFFLALSAMLAFSNAILCYGGLFRQPESAFLLTTPLSSWHLVVLRYVESLVLSSWSFVLLGLPLMLAIARVRNESTLFYPMFLGLFVMFIPLPGAAGMLLAWIIALIAPKTPRRTMIVGGIFLVMVGGWWFRDILQAPVSSNEWLGHFYDRISIVQNAMLPHNWVSKGICHAMQGQIASAGFYLFVTAANALFASVLVIAIVSRTLPRAFARAQISGPGGVRRLGPVWTGIAEVLFAYLSQRQRLLAAKDLKTFVRDPMQWSQMAILVGLLTLYVTNIQQLWSDLVEPGLQALIALLNLTAVCLILATFTTRFVFPIVSLESRQLWLLGLLPLRRSQMIVGKFLFALTVTLLVATAVIGVSVYRLKLPTVLAIAHLVAGAAVCLGLCGVSIGMGARMPVLNERNPARIAGGLGGTVSLFISIALVVISLGAMWMMTIQAVRFGILESMTKPMALWLAAVVVINATAAMAAMIAGIRHFKRIEC